MKTVLLPLLIILASALSAPAFAQDAQASMSPAKLGSPAVAERTVVFATAGDPVRGHPVQMVFLRKETFADGTVCVVAVRADGQGSPGISCDYKARH